MDWAEPILPAVPDRPWEQRVKKQYGLVPDVMTRVSTCGWLREMLLRGLSVSATEMPKHLADIGTLVCSQENACRYCYGVARAQMKLFGYSEKMINTIEQDMLMAELDQKDRTFIRFCRSLARSSPRPSKKERDKLLKLGFSELQVTEMAFQIARECFVNRVVTFISSPPMHDFEQMSNSLMAKLFRPLIAYRLRSKSYKGKGSFQVPEGPFAPVLQAISGVPAAVIFRDGLEGVSESNVLSPELKLLMFAVVARSLNCQYCSDACYTMARDIGFGSESYTQALQTLTCDKLDSQEQRLLAWTRETIHYQTGPIQQRTKELASGTDHDALLEAIGVASLANSVVRLGVLLE